MNDDEIKDPGPQDEVPPPQPWWRKPQNLVAAGLLIIAVVAGGVLIAYNELKRPEDVSNTSVPFEEPVTKEKPKKEKSGAIDWPTFRYDRQRTGFLDVKGIKPPYERVWRYGDTPLLEFPPSIANGVLYFVDNDGHAFALSAKNGHKIWQRRIASLNASTPTYADGRLYIVSLEPGQVMSLDAKTGKQIWKYAGDAPPAAPPAVLTRTAERSSPACAGKRTRSEPDSSTTRRRVTPSSCATLSNTAPIARLASNRRAAAFCFVTSTIRSLTQDGHSCRVRCGVALERHFLAQGDRVHRRAVAGELDRATIHYREMIAEFAGEVEILFDQNDGHVAKPAQI